MVHSSMDMRVDLTASMQVGQSKRLRDNEITAESASERNYDHSVCEQALSIDTRG